MKCGVLLSVLLRKCIVSHGLPARGGSRYDPSLVTPLDQLYRLNPTRLSVDSYSFRLPQSTLLLDSHVLNNNTPNTI